MGCSWAPRTCPSPVWGMRGHLRRHPGQLCVGTAHAVTTHQVLLLKQVVGYPLPWVSTESLPHPCTGWRSCSPLTRSCCGTSTHPQHGSREDQTSTGTATTPVPKTLSAETRHTLSTTLGEKDVPMSQTESLRGATPLSTPDAVNKCSALQHEDARLETCPQ